MDKTPSRSHNRLLVFISGCVLTLLTAGVSCAQSITDGATPLGVSPGAPAGAFALSDLDSVNLYNGNLAFRLPLDKIAGRGGAGYTMVVRLEHKWTVERDQEPGVPTRYIPNPNWWNADGFNVLYSMGRMEMRQGVSRDFFMACGNYIYRETLSRLTFTAPDGTEYELRDQLTDGGARSSDLHQWFQSRPSIYYERWQQRRVHFRHGYS